MPETKEAPNSKEQKPDFVKWFSELNKDSGNIAGGKGANLAEIFNLKLPVPPGFVVTAQAYNYFIEKSRVNQKINEILSKINYENTEQLDKSTDEIRGLIINSKIPEEIKEEIIESYENLDVKNFDTNKRDGALDVLQSSSEPVFVAVRSSATTEDLADASFAGQQDTFLNIKGNTNLLEAIKKCFASLFTSRATYYRNKKGFKHEQAKLAVVVQKMIDSDKSGVIFSKDPSYKNENTIIESVWGLGSGIVSGKINPDNYVSTKELKILNKKIADKKIAITRDAGGNEKIVNLTPEKSKAQVLTDYEIKKLTEYAIRLEEHYKKPQDIEFAIEGEEIYIVQTRPITTLEKRIEKGKEIQGEVILTGLAASPGIASGKIKIISDLKDLKRIIKGDILVTKMTNPDMVVTMQKSAAIVTDDGGLTAHAAIVSREMGIPCIVGTGEATTKLKEGEIITVNGFTGKIYKGKVSETVKKEILPIVEGTKTKIKVMVDLPSFAERASKTKIKEVGLVRIEGIISESGKHPYYFLEQNKIRDYEELVFKGISGIAKYFDELWIRTSDIRTDEFMNLEGAPKEKEVNPMLGMHGIRDSIKNTKILKAELNAMKKVSEQNKKIGILMPQLISVDELKKVKEILNQINFSQLKLGIMIETPASVQIIKELCEEKIDFISFGTNDLTQYTLAIDRGNEEVQYLFDEMNPAILYQLEKVINICKEYNVETSICGQAGSKKEMVKFLVEKGIDSISVNADVAQEISKYVLELEGKTDAQKQEIFGAVKSEEAVSTYDNRKQDFAGEDKIDEEQEMKYQEELKKQEEVSENNFGEEKQIEEQIENKEGEKIIEQNEEEIQEEPEQTEQEENSPIEKQEPEKQNEVLDIF